MVICMCGESVEDHIGGSGGLRAWDPIQVSMSSLTYGP